MRESFLEAARRRVLLADGAMGTQLQAAGLPVGACGEAWNIEAPERVRSIQGRYREAGSDFVLTNTFGGNRLTLERHGRGADAAAFNRAAVRIAREAVGPQGWVAGDIGPFGGVLEPLGDADPDEVEQAFLEQARALVEEGVDVLVVETMTALEELELALRAAHRAAREVAPGGREAVGVVASMAFDRMPSGPPRTMMGVTPEAAAGKMMELGADVLACNCGTNLEPGDYLAILRGFAQVAPGALLMVQPNAGSPVREGGRIVYRESAERMAAGLAPLLDAGARIVGGCCGTTPEHIRAFRQTLDRLGA